MNFPRFIILCVLVLVACQPVTGTSTATLPTLPAPTATSFFTQTPPPQPTFTETPAPIPTVPAAVIELKGAELPPGFSIIKFADLYRPLAFAFDAQGRMYVTSQDGNVYLLLDEDRDGRAESRLTFASAFYVPLGLTVHLATGDVYVSYQGKITQLRDTDGDNKADVQEVFVSDLPFEVHQNDNLKFGPDGWLYIGGVPPAMTPTRAVPPSCVSMWILVTAKFMQRVYGIRLISPSTRRRTICSPLTTAATTWAWMRLLKS